MFEFVLLLIFTKSINWKIYFLNQSISRILKFAAYEKGTLVIT